MAFNLTANLSFQRQANIRPIISDIQKQLTRARFEISVHLDTRAMRQIEGILNRNARASDSVNTSLSNINNTAVKLGQTLSGQRFNASNLKTLNSELAVSKSRFQSLDNSSVKTFSGIATQSYLAYRAVSLLTNQFNEFKEYNSLLTKFAQVSGVSIDKVSDLSKAVRSNAISFGVNSRELLEVATNLRRAGLSADKVQSSLSLFSRLSLSEGISDIRQLTQAYVILDRIFGQSSQEIEQSFNKITNLSAQFANESEDTITGLKITGALFHQLGGTLDEFAATFSATQEASQQSASVIGNALKTILTRISSSPETINALNKIGISLTDLNGKFVGPTKAIEILHNRLGQLDDTDTSKLEVLQKISGTRQVSVLVSLLNSYGRQLEATNILKQNSNKLDRDAEIAQQSLAVKIQSTAEIVKRDFALVFENKQIISFTDNILSLTKALSSLLPVAAPLVPVIAALGVKQLGGRLNVGGLSGIASSVSSSFASGYNQPITRAAPAAKVLPSPNVSSGIVQKAIYARNPHFQSGLDSISGEFGNSFSQKSITGQINLVNKMSLLFADLSLTEKQLSGGMKSIALRMNDGATLEQALNETRKSLARVQAKQAAALGISLNNNTSYVPANKTAGFVGGAKNLLQTHGQGIAALGLLANQANPHGVSRELINTGGGTGLAANVLGLGGPASVGVGLVAAFASYGDVIENEARRLSSNELSKAASDLADKIKLSGGKFTSDVLSGGNDLIEKLRNKQKVTSEDIPFIQGLSTYGSRLIPNALQGKYQDQYDIKNEILTGRDNELKEGIRQSIDGLEAFRQHILGSVKTMQEFRDYGGGLGDKILFFLKTLDPAIEKTTQKLIEATNAKTLQEAIAHNLSNSISKASTEVEAKRRSLPSAYRLGVGRTEFDSTELGTIAYSKQVGKRGLSKEIESTLKDVNTVSRVGSGILAGGKDLGRDNYAESVANQLRFEGVGEKVASAIQDSLEQAGYETFRESLTDIEKASADLISQFNPLVNSTERLRAAQLELVNTRNANFSTAAGQYSNTVDANIQAQLASLSVADSIARYRKGPLDTTSGNLLAQRGAIALGGSADTNKLGHNLKLLSEQFEKTKDSRILETIKQTEQALKLLGDTSLRTRNIEEELNKAKSQKEAKLGALEGFLSQDRKGRLESIRGLALAGHAVTNVGSLNGFDIGSQQKIIAALRSVSDVKLGNGLTGKENLENLLKNTLPGLVAGEEKDIADLTKESIKIQIDAAAATKELAINQERQLSNFLLGLGNENKAFLANLGTLLGTPERLLPRRATGGYVSGPGGPRGDKIPAMLSDGEYVINASAAARLGPERLNALNSVHAASGGGAIQLARRQGISLADARSQLRLQTVRGAYQRTVNYIAGKKHLSNDLNNAMTTYGVSPPIEAFRYARFENSRLGRLGGIQRNGRYRDEFRRKGNRFADGGPVSAAGGNVATGIASAMGQFQSSVLMLSQAVNQLGKINIPSNITHSGNFQHEVIINGAAVLQNLLQGPLADLIAVEIDKSIRKHIPLQQRMEGTY